MRFAGRPIHRGALAASGLLLVGGLWVATEALHYGLWRGTAPAEGLFPFIIGLVIAGLAAAFATEAVNKPDQQAPLSEEEPTGPPAWGKVGLYVVGLAAFGFGLERFGYILVTGAVLLIILRFAERLSWRVSAGVIAGTLVLTHLVFERLLLLPLPRGPLP